MPPICISMAINGDSLGLSKGLAYIVNEYGSTESGQTAKIMLANCYYNLRDFENADKYYKAYSGNSEMFKAAALSGIAAVCETKGDWMNAAKNYEKASKVSKMFQTTMSICSIPSEVISTQRIMII